MTDGRHPAPRPAARSLLAVWALAALLIALLAPALGQAADGDLVFGKGLLWKVQGHGVPTGYLFGTIHSGDKRVARLPAPVKAAFDGSDIFIMEVIPDPSLAERMRQAMVFDDGRALKDVVSESLYKGAVKDLSQYDIPEGVANRLKPWAIATTLSLPETARGEPLDKRLYRMAQKQEKSIFALETAGEQIAVLNKMPLNDQVALLKDAEATFDKRFDIYQTLIDDYLARDVSAIFKLNAKYSTGDTHAARDLNRRIFSTRNERMVKRIIPHLKKGKTFVAIGAGHLPGEDGVLRGLQKKGYEVSLVY